MQKMSDIEFFVLDIAHFLLKERPLSTFLFKHLAASDNGETEAFIFAAILRKRLLLALHLLVAHKKRFSHA